MSKAAARPPLPRTRRGPNERSGRVVRVLLVGGGRRGLQVHLPSIEESWCCELVGVVDVESQIARLCAQLPAGTAVWSDLTQAISRARPDIAVVSTPHDTHVPIAETLMQAGVPTVIDKPPGRTAAEVVRLIDASRRTSTPVSTLLPLRASYVHQRLSRELAGRLEPGMRISISATVAAYSGISGWRNYRTRSGGGVVIDLGYHYLDWVLGLDAGPRYVVKATLGAPTSVNLDESVEMSAQLELVFPEAGVAVDMNLASAAGAVGQGHIVARGNGWAMSATRQGISMREGERSSVLIRGREGRQPPAMIERLLESGFVRGGGEWREELGRSLSVLTCVEEIYRAGQVAAPPHLMTEIVS